MAKTCQVRRLSGFEEVHRHVHAVQLQFDSLADEILHRHLAVSQVPAIGHCAAADEEPRLLIALRFLRVQRPRSWIGCLARRGGSSGLQKVSSINHFNDSSRRPPKDTIMYENDFLQRFVWSPAAIFWRFAAEFGGKVLTFIRQERFPSRGNFGGYAVYQAR